MTGLTQQRVSQLVKTGAIVAERDPEGVYQYDRASVERFAADRAARQARDPAIAEERRIMQEEARERFARARKNREREERDRREWTDKMLARAVAALERIAACGK